MGARLRRPRSLLFAPALAVLLAGCGKGASEPSPSGSIRTLAPVAQQGAVSLSTRNTTRLGGTDVAADAAAVARAVYPGLTPQTRPATVVLADESQWEAALAASSLASAPTNAPLLYSQGGTLPDVSASTLSAMAPTGLAALGGAQVIRIGSAPAPAGLVPRSVAAGEPADTAVAIERVLESASGGSRPRQVIVVPVGAPRAMQMPAAGLAAESGAPILFATATSVPHATVDLLRRLAHPGIYVIDSGELSARTLRELANFGAVTKIEPTPATPTAGTPPAAPGAATANAAAANAIAVARFTDGTFGWGVKEPGHGLVFANSGRPLDAPAAALLSATGDYGPLLLLERATEIPPELAAYLSDIQPAYTSAPQFQPVRGVYNHGWLMGDEGAISATTQAEIDSLLEISPRSQSTGEASASQAE
jgi:hypothetical protein